jgi:hypothetical protein
VPELSALARKLRLQPGSRAAFVNAPPSYLDSVHPLPEGVEVVSGAERDLDFLQLFARDTAELARLGGPAVRRVRHDGILWVAYPKGGARKGLTDLPASPWWRRRDVLGDLTGERGYLVVALVSLDDTWSAVRFKPAETGALHRSGAGPP